MTRSSDSPSYAPFTKVRRCIITAKGGCPPPVIENEAWALNALLDSRNSFSQIGPGVSHPPNNALSIAGSENIHSPRHAFLAMRAALGKASQDCFPSYDKTADKADRRNREL
jgi:hypothetical protein